MPENENETLKQIKEYVLNFAWPYVVGYINDPYAYEIDEIGLTETENGYITRGWKVLFYPDINAVDKPLSCFIALFKTGEISIFRKTQEQWLTEARNHYKFERYDNALYACEHILKLDPKNTRAYHGKALSLLKLRRFKEALTVYEQVITIAPRQAEVFYNEAGNILYDIEQYEEALVIYDQLLKLNPRDDRAYINKGYLLFELKRYAHVLAPLEKSLQINPRNIDSYQNMASNLQYMGAYEEALVAYTRLISSRPYNYDFQYERSFALFKLSRFKEALNSIKKTILIRPTSYAYCMCGDIFFHLGYYEKALAAYEKSINFIDQNDPALYKWGASALSSDHYENLIASYQIFIESRQYAGNTQDAYIRLGGLFYRFERYDEALTIYNKAYQLDAVSYYNKGLLLFNTHAYEKALMAFKASINLDVRNADAWRMKGDILKILNRPDAFSMHYEVAGIVAFWDGEVHELKQLIFQLAKAYIRDSFRIDG